MAEETAPPEYPYEKVQLKDLENPMDLAYRPIPMRYEGIEFILIYDKQRSSYVIIEKKRRIRRQISNLDELKDYYFNMKDLKHHSRTIQLKWDSIKKYLKLKLKFLYHLRSCYYHAGELQVSKDTDFIVLGPWTYGGKTYFPLIEKRLVPSFEEISRKAIISIWRQRLKTLTKTSST